VRWSNGKSADPMEWHRWFAWYPVNDHGEMIWMEWVERKRVHQLPLALGGGVKMFSIRGWWEYREDGVLETEEKIRGTQKRSYSARGSDGNFQF